MKFKLVDANQEEMEVTMSQITDVNTDGSTDISNLNDSDDQDFDFSPAIFDADGETALKLEDALKAMDSSENKVIAIDVTFEATHSGVNANNVNYVGDSMEKDAKSWMYPYPKPFLKNHDMATEPLGRVKAAGHGQSIFDSEKSCIDVEFRVTDRDAMTKVLDGRYKTMSIGGNSRNIKCDLCNKDIMKDGVLNFCGHWKGKMYDKKKATWTCTDIDYNEGSVVNNPADKFAQVKKIVLVKAGEEVKPSNDKNEGKADVSDAIDDLLNIVDSTPVEQTPVEEATPVEETTEEVKDATVETVESVKVLLEDSKKEIEKLKGELEGANKLKDEILADKVKTENEFNVLQASLSSLRDSFVNTAVEYRKLISKNIIAKEISKGLLSDSDKEDRLKTLLASKTDSLKDMLDEAEKEVIPTKVAPVSSPALVTDFEKEEETEKVEVKDATINDKSYARLEQDIISSMMNNRR